MNSPEGPSRSAEFRLYRRWQSDRQLRAIEAPGAPLGRLADGTSIFAPLGQLVYDPELDAVQCHLCGLWFRRINTQHLRRHAWTIEEYKVTMGLELHRPLFTPTLSAKWAEHARRRLKSDPKFRAGLEHAQAVRGTARVRQLQIEAVTGRPLSIEQVRKASHARILNARERRIKEADAIARRLGFHSFDTYWRDRCGKEFTLPAIAREVGRSSWWVRQTVTQLQNPPAPRSQEWDRADVLKALIAERARLGRWPTTVERQRDRLRPTLHTVLRHFKTWGQALEAASAIMEAEAER